MELDPRYVDVIVARWQNLTGSKAVLNGEGLRAGHLLSEGT
jgi:DNA modification methylase